MVKMIWTKDWEKKRRGLGRIWGWEGEGRGYRDDFVRL